MKTLTTVVIPNYNGISYLEDCLASIYEGTKIPKVIVVDNGSSDGSDKTAAEKFPEVRLIRLLENTGFCHAVNVGIREADTEFVFLLNNDTKVDKDCVEELEKAMLSSKRTFSAGAKMIRMKFPEKTDDAGDFYCALGWAFARGKDKPVRNYEKSGRIFAACGGAAMYRRELFEEIGLFDEAHFAYLEDIDLGYRANIYGYKNIFVPKAKVLHAGSATSGSKHNAFKVALSAQNSIYLIYKNMPALQVLLNLPFLLLGFLLKTLFFVKKGLGREYVRGLKKGFSLSFSKEGRERRVRFQAGRFPAYFWIQLELLLSFLYFL